MQYGFKILLLLIGFRYNDEDFKNINKHNNEKSL